MANQIGDGEQIQNLSQNRHSQPGRPGDTEARTGSGTGSKKKPVYYHWGEEVRVAQ